MENKVYNALIDMGSPIKAQGVPYIAEALRIYDSSADWLSIGTMDLYSKIAEKYRTTPARVERGIRYVFDYTSKSGDPVAVEKYIGKNVKGKSNRLATFYIRLKQEG